jgi:hypothetical protein
VSDGLAARAWRAASSVAQAVAGGVNAAARATSGRTVSTVGDLSRPPATSARTVTQLLQALVSQAAGVLVSATASGTARPSTLAGWVSSAVGALARPAQTSALRVVQVTYAYTGLRYGSAAAGYVVATRNDWTNPANANGTPDASVAAFAGNLTAARAGGVDVTLPAITGKNELSITQVLLRFYVAQAGTTLGNGTLKYGRRSSAGTRTQLGAATGNITNTATPIDVDLTALVAGDWNAFGTVLAGAYVEASTAAANTHTASFAGVELRITATRTDTP